MSEMSSIIAGLGAGSGIDMVKLASDLADAQFALRNDRLAAKTEKLEQQISAASSLKNTLSALAGALGDRVRAGDLAVKPQIGNPAVATASSPSGTTGSGSYSLEVLALARGQTLASPAVADPAAVVGAGSLTFRFGTTDGTGFTADAEQAAVTVDIASGSTLTDIANAINAKKAGISAYVAQTAQGAQLVLKGPEGAQSGFIVEATETAGEEGLGALAWDPTAGGDPARLLAASADAEFKLDGLAMTSATNDVGTVAPGLELELTGTNAGMPTTIGFPSPVGTIATAMQDIVGALNEVVSELYTATDPMSGDLARDPGARALKRTLSELSGTVIMPNAPEGAPRTLADLGLVIQRDGTFRLDTQRLDATLERDPGGVAAMFTTGLYGVYATVDRISRQASRTGDPGSLAGSIARYQSQSTDLSDEAAKLADQQEALRANMVARFAKADSRIAASQSTLSFLQSQIDAWNASKD
ncbi:flagellar filament capping protein FliD [Pelagerythrobacter rhizovicinus]|uniref:Flagellar hook-associated protein 2 n=1 Tax=Pelagerythrobacter rhizovicinus TaxID=2268576 RepID=A0A4Q2KLI2_9SPHN|nr:flagellar filament capping protein FliD [Pelagerythrobacter rhizovicinus]RXZ65257.1 flagellar hook protein [Pelagerythrobacter rhizovicinus]